MNAKSVYKAFDDYSRTANIERDESISRSVRNHWPDLSLQEFRRLLSVDANFRKNYDPNYESNLNLTKNRDNSFRQQRVLLRIIQTILEDENLPEIRKSGKGQVWYLLGNAVASYSSYNPYYWISTSALIVLNEYGIDVNRPVSRSKIFQIRKKDRKKILTFEHMCPSSQLIDLLIEKVGSISVNINQGSYLSKEDQILKAIKLFFKEYGLVAIITKDEDSKLVGDLRTKLDTNIAISLDRMLNRYNKSGITLADDLIPVFGKMYR